MTEVITLNRQESEGQDKEQALGEGALVSDAEKAALVAGLSAKNKYISPKYFYDAVGSDLFDRITRLPEYYLTRTEKQILETHRQAIADFLPADLMIIEPGAGSCEKIQILLPALKPRCYMPIDIAQEYLVQAAKALQQTFPALDIRPVGGDMKMAYPVPVSHRAQPRLVFYPGSTIGNYDPDQALDFLRHVHDQLRTGDRLLIGIDMHKNADILNAAYNDTQGVTALFNLNILAHVNGLTGSDFRLELFDHIAFYNEQERRIEMHLESRAGHVVTLPGHRPIPFAKGERLHTEYSYKHTQESFSALASHAGFIFENMWTDDNDWFSLQLYKKR